MARPKKKSTRQEGCRVRLTKREKMILDDLAKRLGMTKSEALRTAMTFAHVVTVDNQERAERLGEYLYEIQVAPHLGRNAFFISVPFTPGETLTYRYRKPVYYLKKYVEDEEGENDG